MSRRRARRGSSTAGCLVWLVIFGVALYYGSHVGSVYWRFYQYEEEMASQARLAPSLTDAVIRRRLHALVDELDLPPEAGRIKIERTGKPRRISISAEYSDSLALPLVRKTIRFKPHAVAPL